MKRKRPIPNPRPVCRSLLRALLLVCVLACAGIQAAEVEDLYEAQVPVVSQTESERGTALATAFEAVLVKVTGQRDVMTTPEIQEAVKRPMGFVQQYLYRPLPVIDGDEPTPHTQIMRVRFDAQAINALVQRADVPLWGRVRPTTLLWIAVEDGGNRFMLGGDGREDLRALLEREAQRRGLPILLPLLDLEDRNQLFFTDVWGNFQGAVLQASNRYQVAAVVVGRLLRRPDGDWSTRWSLYHDGAAEHWSLGAGGPTEAFAGGIDGIADRLGALYARQISAEGRQLADVAVSGVNGLRDYNRVLSYLRGLEQVGELQVLKVEGDSVFFRVKLGGDPDGLERTIAFGTTLARMPPDAMPLPVPGGVADEAWQMSYRLLP